MSFPVLSGVLCIVKSAANSLSFGRLAIRRQSDRPTELVSRPLASKCWVGQVDGLVGAATETARLADLEVEVRDLLSA